MLLTDYFRSERDITWDYAKQCGVNHGVIRLPETVDFNVCDFSHWKTVHKRFTDFGIIPVVIEPMPNELHDHIKIGDEKRDECIEKAMNVRKSKNLGITMCQATYKMMSEDLQEVIPRFADKIMFIHFRNVTGTKTAFRETFHDNGEIDMAEIMKLYVKYGIDVPVRVDHVLTMAGEKVEIAGYDSLGRLYAIGYLKGILESCIIRNM